MFDDEMRRRLFWNQLGELLFVAVCAGTVAFWAIQMVATAMQDGQVTLYAGGSQGPKTPVHLSLGELPFGVVGAALIFCSFAISMLGLLSNSAYQVLRTGLPTLALPRVPSSVWLRRITTLHFGAALLLCGIGVVLVSIQYILVTFR